MTTDTPAPAPEWAHDMVQEFENSGGVGPLSADAYVRFVALLATLRERTLREAADNLRALAPNGAGYRRKEWDDFNFDLPCADAIDMALKIGEDAILSLIAQPPKEST